MGSENLPDKSAEGWLNTLRVSFISLCLIQAVTISFRVVLASTLIYDQAGNPASGLSRAVVILLSLSLPPPPIVPPPPPFIAAFSPPPWAPFQGASQERGEGVMRAHLAAHR